MKSPQYEERDSGYEVGGHGNGVSWRSARQAGKDRRSLSYACHVLAARASLASCRKHPTATHALTRGVISASSDAEIASITQVFGNRERPGSRVHNIAGGIGHVETSSTAL
jgi:hypothetical protein